MFNSVTLGVSNTHLFLLVEKEYLIVCPFGVDVSTEQRLIQQSNLAVHIQSNIFYGYYCN
jgi:hypothetical protein